MKTLDLIQGSDEWETTRARHFTASEAPAMMGASKKCTRSELLRMKATVSEKEFTEWVQANLLDKGHDIEAAARPLAEAFIGDELYPITGIDDDGYLLASYDGMTMLETISWECKSWNEAKAAVVREGNVPEEDVWQLVQQQYVGETEQVLYTLSDGTEDKTLHVWFKATEEQFQQLIAGWQQFQDDLDNYQHVEETPAPEGKAPDTLPALHIELTGMVTASNLVQFKDTAMAVIDSVGTELQTDSDFADAEKAVKWCKEVETRLDAAKEHALSQTASIDQLFRTLDEIKDEARRKRLTLEKKVKSRKETIRIEIVNGGKTALAEHVEALNKRLGFKYMPAIDADFLGVIKNKRTVSSLRDAVDTELARCKIDANAIADRIQLNLKLLQEQASEHKGLFADVKTLVLKDPEDLESIIKARIAEHKEAEEKRLEEERERIRKEEQEKAEADAKKRQQEEQEQAHAVANAAPAHEAITETDQRGNPTEATHGEPMATVSPQAPVASTSPITEPPSRPSDLEIIEVLALHYRVHESKVIEWLVDMDLVAEGEKLATSM